MVHLIAFLQAPQDRDRVFHRGLIHEHLLEAPLQGGIFFNVFAVFIEGGGADATQFPPGQHRFQQVAGIHRPPSGAGPHHRVDLIDKQHDLPLAGGHLLEHSLEPFFKFTAVLGTGD